MTRLSAASRHSLQVSALGILVFALLAASCGGADAPWTKTPAVAIDSMRVEMHFNPG